MEAIYPYLFTVCGIISLIYVFSLKDSGDIKSCIVTGIVCLALGYFTWSESEEDEAEYYSTMQYNYQPSSISFTGESFNTASRINSNKEYQRVKAIEHYNDLVKTKKSLEPTSLLHSSYNEMIIKQRGFINSLGGW